MRLAISRVFLLCQLVLACGARSQGYVPDAYWNSSTQLTPFRLPPPPADFTPEYLDLNGDGRPDAIRTLTHQNVPVLWLDDDGNMEPGDLEGDMVNDCLLLDRNKDGVYDLVVKWADLDGDGKADLQLIAEGYYGEHRQKIVLRKSYVCSPDGIQVRFILMNNDSDPVSAVLATELTFEVPIQKPSEVSAEILLGDNLECYEESDMSARTVQYEGVSIVRLSNQSANLSLVFEPNECAGYCQYPVSFCRPPDCYAAESVMNKVPVGKSLSCTFYWNVDIEPGHNIEKTLSMGITTPPKRRRHGRD